LCAVGACWVHDFVTAKTNPKLIAVGATHTFDKSLTVRIVHQHTCCELPNDGAIGELWIAGPSVAAGYYGQPELSADTFRAMLAEPSPTGAPLGPWLRTGDLAFMEGGHLFICGRIKDIIIANGRNVYPQVSLCA
jgi:acyl-CoA synthetase (AMP-forming)/AMP-acid ligase II